MSDDDDSMGPIESGDWPEHLTARAVDGSRFFGYDVQEDLARHYRYSDVLYLALTGELPDDARSRAFGTILVFSSTMSVGEAPVHATMLAQLCGARPGGVLSVAALSIGEHVEPLVARVSEILSSMGTLANGAALPDDLRATSDDERLSVARLRTQLEPFVPVPTHEMDPSLDVALVATLRACGLDAVFPIVAALVVGRLPSAVAEARLTRSGDFRHYPMNTPRFVYVPGKE